MTKPLAGQAAAMGKSKVRLKCRSAVSTMMMLEPIRGPPETHSLHTHTPPPPPTSPRLCLSSWVQHRILQHRDPTHSTPPSLASPKSQVPTPPGPQAGRPLRPHMPYRTLHARSVRRRAANFTPSTSPRPVPACWLCKRWRSAKRQEYVM